MPFTCKMVFINVFIVITISLIASIIISSMVAFIVPFIVITMGARLLQLMLWECLVSCCILQGAGISMPSLSAYPL